MAYLVLSRSKLKHNYEFLDRLFARRQVFWAPVSKLLCGNELFLRELIDLGSEYLCDSRIVNLKVIKQISQSTKTVFIKPAPAYFAAAVVRYADVSFNTEFCTLKLLSLEAVKQDKIHKVVLMVELGERREGLMPSAMAAFYEKTCALPNIEVVGVGANFMCLSGVMPDREKLEQLVECSDAIFGRFNRRLLWVSGGTSVVIPLLYEDQVPSGMNHFRVGETLFFGTDVYNTGALTGMCQDVMTFYAEIIELIKKPMQPDGTMGLNVEGNTVEINDSDIGLVTWRAILNVGLLDVEMGHLVPTDESVECLGASSDMLVVNLGLNRSGYKTGDCIEFKVDYMGALRLMHSKYVQKRVED